LYNTILEAHERYGRHASPRISFSEFQEWLDSDDILYLPTRGSSFTWSNGKRGSRNTEKHLDRDVCNQLWIDSWTSSNWCTLIKYNFDHYPLLLDFQHNQIMYVSSFR